jgi:FkbM family methyltransferase
MLEGLHRHITRGFHYSSAFQVACYWWNIVLRRFPRLWLPFRNAVVDLKHRGRDIKFSVRLGATDWYVANEIFEADEYGAVREWDPHGFATIVDLGANIGLSVLVWAALSPNALVAAVEPDAGNLALLRRNIDASAVSERVVIIPSFVAATSGYAAADRCGGEWAIKMSSKPGEDRIPVSSMEDILAAIGSPHEVDLMKCDIEGAEAEIFKSCSSWVQRIRHLVIELHPPYSVEILSGDLRANGAQMLVTKRIASGNHQIVFLQKTSS